MIIIQAGHENIASNCDPALRGETGAPGEEQINVSIANLVVLKLLSLGVEARAVDANFNCDPTVAQPYEAVIALHCQSDPPAESGWDVGVGDPARDGAAAESARLALNIAAWYEAATGLSRRNWCQNNPNVQDYYLFNALASTTPFCLIEMMNVVLDYDYYVLNTYRMVDGIVNGILGFLGRQTIAIPTSPPEPAQTTQPTQSVTPTIDAVIALLEEVLTKLKEIA